MAASAAAVGEPNTPARDRLANRSQKIESPWRFARTLATRLEEDAKRAEQTL
jgi:hypothetical protein